MQVGTNESPLRYENAALVDALPYEITEKRFSAERESRKTAVLRRFGNPNLRRIRQTEEPPERAAPESGASD